MDLLVNAVIADNARSAMRRAAPLEDADTSGVPPYLQLMDVIETQLEG